MTMWPKKEEKAGRKWVCFVCGKSHSDFDSYKEHILSSHDEGREFVKCPLEHCGAPVRDLKLHYRAKHPDRQVPQAAQMKAIIWKDPTKEGKMKTRKPKFREGYFVSNKNGGREFHYRSGWECEVYECLEVLPEVVAYDAEPLKGGIPYLFKGEAHHYFPDLSLQFNDGHVEIWEVKPASQMDLEINQAKWNAATQFCESRGWDFIVINEVGIGKLKNKARKAQQN